ncbi:MAG: PAS domain S-box protein, partial [Proteobacteria bacterium]|nr:PAS domain S-box protein [Pseudomonadota bacterium]
MLDGFALHEIITDEAGQPVDYRFLAVNPAFENLTGLKADDIVGKTVLEVMPNTERHWIEAYGRVALQGEEVHFENYSVELDKVYEIKAYSPAPRQFGVIFVDVTKSREASRALGKSVTRFRSILQKVPQVCITLDAKGCITFANEYFLALTDWTNAEVLGKNWFDLFIPPEKRDEVRGVFAATMAQEPVGVFSNHENEILARNGDRFNILWSNVMDMHLDGSAQSITSLGVNLTERLRYEEQMRQTMEQAEMANRAKSEFLANMSHELRTPLNGALGMLQLLRMTNLDGEQGQYADTAIRSCRNLTELLGDILDLSRVEAGKLEICKRRLGPRDLLTMVRDTFADVAAAKNIILS